MGTRRRTPVSKMLPPRNPLAIARAECVRIKARDVFGNYFDGDAWLFSRQLLTSGTVGIPWFVASESDEGSALVLQRLSELAHIVSASALPQRVQVARKNRKKNLVT